MTLTRLRDGLPDRRRATGFRCAAFLALSTALALGAVSAQRVLAQAPSSASFLLNQSTVSASGVSAASTSFVLDSSAAQPATVGEATTSSYLLQSGFWTSLSTKLLLRVEGAGTGSGMVTTAGIACDLDAGVASGDCTEKLTHSASIALVAAPDAASRFDGWVGCDGSTTTNETDDTCLATLTAGRTVTASFTLLGTLGNRVWRDGDGDGVQDAGEPGLDGVVVTISAPGGFSDSGVAAGGGFYGFIDVPPDTYTVSVDTASLPAGVVPTYDVDGVGTPHTTQVVLAAGENRADVDFGYRPRVDLAITKEDSEDPLPGGENLIYTITVENLGPGIATSVTVTDVLPTGVTLVETVGCPEDPAGVPTCSLGDLGVDGMASYTVEVSIDPAPPASIENTATVTAVELDLDAANDSASQSTALDAAPPRVELVDTDETADGELVDCETVFGRPVRDLLVRFSEPMLDQGAGTAAGDVTNPASWSLVAAGSDAELDTVGCGPAAGDDVAVAFDAIAYDTATDTATLSLAAGERLAASLYRLFACGTGSSVLTDLASNPLDGDGDGSAGDDFVRFFRADPDNLLADGHFDCDLGAWIPVSANPNEIFYAEDDVDGSADSGSAAVENLTASTEFALGQCRPAAPGIDYALSGRVRMTTSASIGVRMACEFFGGADCGGTALGVATISTLLLGDTGASWVEIDDQVAAPAGTASMLCAVDLLSPAGATFEARLDHLRVVDSEAAIFEDGFESGDTSAWSQ